MTTIDWRYDWLIDGLTLTTIVPKAAQAGVHKRVGAILKLRRLKTKKPTVPESRAMVDGDGDDEEDDDE